MRHTLRYSVLALATMLGMTLGAPNAHGLPDLIPEIFDLSVRVGDVVQGDVNEGCAGGRYSRRLVKFSLRTHNTGDSDLTLGNPGCPNCTINPGAACSNPLFVCGESHGHAHFESFARNEIVDGDGTVVAQGRKYGFCLLDLNCPNPHYSCSYQGITAGCSDVYSAGLPCQYVDITDENLADGVYKLRVNIDPDNIFPESNDLNNVIEVPFTIGDTDRICPIYASSDVPQTIPDPGNVTSVVTVPDLGPVTSVRMRMKGTHGYLGDLQVTLSNPEATSRTLFSGVCGTQNNFDLYLGDNAIDPFVCPATDAAVLRDPLESLSAFHGQEAGGDWTLSITDTSAGDIGVLNAWSLEICSICGNGFIDFGESCDDGNQANGDCCSSDCQIASADGLSCEDGNQCTTAETCQAGSCIAGGDVTCDPCLVCNANSGCVVPDLVYPCQQPPTDGSLLRIRRDPLSPSKDSILWKWRSQTPVELDELGAPDTLTDLSLCVYAAGSLVMSATIPAGATCANDESCWRISDSTAQFKDRDGFYGGLARLRLREGTKGKLLTRGSGENLGVPALFLPLPVTVRLRRNDGTPCWEANYDSTRSSSEKLFKTRSR